jgi:putative endonuclease
MVLPLQLNKRQQGQVYEVMAEQYLQRHHLKPVERNFTCRSGEIDLIMRDKSCVVFVEVKFRKQNHFGSAAEAVNWRKQQKLKRAALLWLKKNSLSTEHTEFRFDVVAIQGPDQQIEWFTNTLVEG